MKDSKMDRTIRLLKAMERRGFDYSETKALLRIERTLQRWGELECGNDRGHVERDEKTGKCTQVSFNPHTGKEYRSPCVDREASALRHLGRIMAKHPEYTVYHQGDCRGCNLYLVSKEDLCGASIDSAYSRGLAVCL